MFESMHALCDKKKLQAILLKYKISNKVHQDVVKRYIKPSNIFDWDETLQSKFTNELQTYAKLILKDGDKINFIKLVEIGIHYKRICLMMTLENVNAIIVIH